MIQLPASPQDSPNNANPEPLSLDLSAMTAIGRHNRENAAAAALLCMALELPSLSPSLIQQALPSLTPPPHRMQLGEGRKIFREQRMDLWHTGSEKQFSSHCLQQTRPNLIPPLRRTQLGEERIIPLQNMNTLQRIITIGKLSSNKHCEVGPLVCAGRSCMPNHFSKTVLQFVSFKECQRVLTLRLVECMSLCPCIRPVHTDEWGVQWINDSKATNVESTLVGVAGLMFSSPNTQSPQEGNQGEGDSNGEIRREGTELDSAPTAAATHPSSCGNPTDTGSPTAAVQKSSADVNKPGQARLPPGAVVLLGGIAKVLKSSDGGNNGAAGGLGFWQLVEPLNCQKAVVTVREEIECGFYGPTRDGVYLSSTISRCVWS